MTDKRMLILQATQKLLNQEGYANLTVSRIAKESGIGKGTVYEYFSSKDEILEQALAEYARSECDAICKPLDPKLSLCQTVHALVLRLCDLFERNAAMLSIFWTTMQQQGVPKHLADHLCQMLEPFRERYIRFVYHLFQQALSHGELACMPDDFETGYISIGLASYISMQFRSGVIQTTSYQQFTRRCTEMVLRQLPLSEDKSHA